MTNPIIAYLAAAYESGKMVTCVSPDDRSNARSIEVTFGDGSTDVHKVAESHEEFMKYWKQASSWSKIRWAGPISVGDIIEVGGNRDHFVIGEILVPATDLPPKFYAKVLQINGEHAIVEITDGNYKGATGKVVINQ